MESWFTVVVCVCVAAVIKSLLIFDRKHGKKLPPGPSFISSNFLLLTRSRLELKTSLKNLKSTYGQLLTLYIGFRPSIFVGSHSLAHRLLIQKGAVFSDRPKSFAKRNISSASYGPTWRLFRRNLSSEILHPSRVTSYSSARKWILQILLTRLQNDDEAASGVEVMHHFTYAMFGLLVFMCFGEKLDETQINEIARVHRDKLLRTQSGRFTVLTMFPKLGKILFRNRWREFEKFRVDKEEVLIPLIKSRIEATNNKSQDDDVDDDDDQVVAYVDTLVNLQLPEEEGKNGNNGKLSEKEMMSMCSEFLNAGTDTTSTALQWIMANLVKHHEIQTKLYDEIVSVVGPPPGLELGFVINEEDLKKMGYLKAVVLEGLRRHPPGHFALPHTATKEVEVEGFTIPEGATINFMVAEMGLDPKVWDEPMEFKPERFLVNDIDITGSRGIKMMPFGAGRRICPGLDLGMLHLEYFVANLIWYFHWSPPDGYEVDLSEKLDFTTVMKNPLQAQISTRTQESTS